jgi:hypothetical protein
LAGFLDHQKAPGHQKAARRGGEKDEGIFQWIGLTGSITWPAEYPFTGCTIATEPYRKMTPRLPDGNQMIFFPSELAGRLDQSFNFHFLQLNFHAISGAFHHIYLQQMLGCGGISPGSDCNRHPPVITLILHFSAFCDTF